MRSFSGQHGKKSLQKIRCFPLLRLSPKPQCPKGGEKLQLTPEAFLGRDQPLRRHLMIFSEDHFHPGRLLHDGPNA